MEQLIFHLVGDYLLQCDWMAKYKKQQGSLGFIACTLHCMLYSVPFFLIGSPIQVFLIFLSHFLIDRTQFIRHYMKVAGQSDFAKPPLAPWSIIMVDNTFHLLCNYLILLTNPVYIF